jgi:hypothetical protein
MGDSSSEHACSGQAGSAGSKDVRDLVCGFMFCFPFESTAKARGKQLCGGTELVQNQY